MYQKIKYVADDGAEFETENECFEYELEGSLFKKVKFYDAEGERLLFPDKFYNIKSLKNRGSLGEWTSEVQNIFYIVFNIENRPFDKQDRRKVKKILQKLCETFSLFGLAYNMKDLSVFIEGGERVFYFDGTQWEPAGYGFNYFSSELSILLKIHSENYLDIPTEASLKIANFQKDFTNYSQKNN